MKRFFSKNRKLVEIFLTLGLVFMVAGYYYLMYIPERENEIITRRFRTLQRIEQNMSEKFLGYIATLKNCFSKADETFFDELVKGYNKEPDKFQIAVVKNEPIKRSDMRAGTREGDSLLRNYDSLINSMNDSICESRKVRAAKDGKTLVITYDWYKSRGKFQGSIKHITLIATIVYKEFVAPLLRKNVFDQYVVFNVQEEASNIVYEDFPSGISFKGLDSLFDAKEKVYTSRIIKIETGGVKYLAFLHPCGYNNKNDRIIAGLLRQERFDKEKRQLPENVVTTILFIALFSILLLPIIRLALMGKKERIRFVDLFAGYFSLLLLVPVVILVFFGYNRYFLPETEDKYNAKKILADQLSKGLNNEISAAYALLDTIDGLHANNGKPWLLDKINISHLDDSARVHNFEKENLKDQSLIVKAVGTLNSVINANQSRYRHTEYVFWMDLKGKETANWAFADDPPRGNYKGRNYFKNVQQNNLILLNGSPDKLYAIEPIVSRIDGKFKVVLAKHSKKQGFVVAAPSLFISVVNPVLPEGYTFSITDNEGKTIFDSDTTHNLNENLLEEFTEPASFRVVLNTKTALEFTTRYEDEAYNVLAQPINGLPYFIVIFHKKSFDSSLKTQSFSFTMVMMLSFFIFLCLELLIILFAHLQSTNLLKNRFELSWLYPRQSFRHKYLFMFLNHATVLIVLALFCFTGFSAQRLTEYIFLITMATLLTSIAACSYDWANTDNKFNYPQKMLRKRYTIIALSLLAMIVLVGSFRYAVYKNVLLFSLASVALFFMLSFLVRYLKGKAFNNYMTNFSLMVFSRLLLTSGLPVIVFFACIYNFEQRLEKRFKLLQYAAAIEKRVSRNSTLQSIANQINAKNDITGFYTDSTWIMNHVDINQHYSFNTAYDYTDSASINLLKTSRLHYNDVSESTENFELIEPFSNNGKYPFAFNSIFSSGADSLNYRINEMEKNKLNTKYITLTSAGFNQFKIPSLFANAGGFLFWFLIAASLYACYRILQFALIKIFGKNIPDVKNFKMIHENLLGDRNIKYLFVQGIPGAGKSSFLKDSLDASEKLALTDNHASIPANKIKFLNLNEIPDEAEMQIEKEKYTQQAGSVNPDKNNWFYKEATLTHTAIEYIVFTHFEYKIFDEFTNKVKLNLIEKIARLDKKKIIISSDIDPVEYFYSLKKFMNDPSANASKKAESKNDGKAPVNEKQPAESFLEYINRWNNLLGRFTNIYMNIEMPVSNEATDPSFKGEFLATECSNPQFLKNYKTQLESLPLDESNEEEYILKIQSLCYHSYRHVWYSLTKEEQLALYDLAEDGLMNTTNFIPVMMLLNKGLVIRKDGVLSLMNRSFRNFILTVVNSKEVQRIENEISDYHTWNDYKYPVLIILGALLYFVLSSNPEKFGNVLPVVSGVMAGIPTIMKLLSFLRPGEVKS